MNKLGTDRPIQFTHRFDRDRHRKLQLDKSPLKKEG